MLRKKPWAALVAVSALLQLSRGDESTHTVTARFDRRGRLTGCVLVQYAVGEPVKLWANKVGPYHNPQEVPASAPMRLTSLPQETYLYHSLPYCRPYVHERKSHSLGDALEGNTLINTGIKIAFLSTSNLM